MKPLHIPTRQLLSSTNDRLVTLHRSVVLGCINRAGVGLLSMQQTHRSLRAVVLVSVDILSLVAAFMQSFYASSRWGFDGKLQQDKEYLFSDTSYLL